MIMKMFSIHDRLNGYTPPIPFLSQDLAERYFKDQYIGNPTVRNTPEDFNLVYMGTFDIDSGTFIQDPQRDITIVKKGVEINGNKDNTL